MPIKHQPFGDRKARMRKVESLGTALLDHSDALAELEAREARLNQTEAVDKAALASKYNINAGRDVS